MDTSKSLPAHELTPGVIAGPLCQFHTASPAHEAYIANEGPQVWRGSVTIAYRAEELRAAIERLQKLVAGVLAGTQCTVNPSPCGQRFATVLKITLMCIENVFSSAHQFTAPSETIVLFIHVTLPFPVLGQL